VRRWLLMVMLGALLVPACATRTPQEAAVAPPSPSPHEAYHGTWQDRPLRMPEETLRNTSGQPYNLRTTPSQPIRLVYLGYVDCPNICVTMLSDVAAGLQRLDPSTRAEVEFLFVDIRPEEDTPEEMRAWLDRFNPEFTGLHGSPEQVDRIAARLGVAMHDEGGEHGLLHSAHVVGFNRHGEGVIIWHPGFTRDQFSADLTRLAAHQR
jgi:protein SCO1